MTIKNDLLQAIQSGEMSNPFTVRDFKRLFPNIKSHTSFCPEATIEPGRVMPTNKRYLIRVAKGIYKVHSDILA